MSYDSDPYSGRGYPNDTTEEKEGTWRKMVNAVKAAVVFQRRDLGRYTKRRETSQAAQEWKREANFLSRAVDEYSNGITPTLPPVGEECAPASSTRSLSDLKRTGTMLKSIRRKKKDEPQVVVVRSSEAYNRLEYVPTVTEEEYYRPAHKRRPSSYHAPTSPPIA
ncbi:hypothetical protein M427DRAFT_55737 [Gonapodya prolifera JEL478]|uniref:Uncharacterized protein n=1 Tax=Gonapodya prolifera (strain JEL478) TaxID=1344416 RepID=A0A139AHN6_GONPJ|nr:hypothetical protein M427DRAFT_55737 [Gonapodya prolifera JEL478]|eukprot:KXS16307.1 hypothetical protein M427DRAFT_55737 [Gonapodya prolifera JEL478]